MKTAIKKYSVLAGLLFLLPLFGRAQSKITGNLRQKYFSFSADTIKLDSLSIVPGSEILQFSTGDLADTSVYSLDPLHGKLFFKRPFNDSIRISYRTFPFDFYQKFSKKSADKLAPDIYGNYNPFTYTARDEQKDAFSMEGLNKNGSISRGINIGNNQDLSVNSNLSLQLSGKVSDNISVLAAISDNNIPLQAEGNTQQLQEFDQVYIQLFDDRSKLTAGDFQLTRPKSYFMNFYKRARGGSFSTAFHTGKSKYDSIPAPTMHITASGAVSKGKFSRQVLQGIEGNQGPYRLRGAENELFIVVLSGTELVYIDGILQVRGQENDYVIDYNTAEITFTARQLITKDKRIIVEFQYSDKNYARSLVHFGDQFISKKVNLRVNYYSEQDSKSQPLQQDLNDEQKLLMASIGDSIRDAIYPNIQQIAFTPDQVLYRVTDTILPDGSFYDSVFVYSTNPENAFYRLGFSFVGENKGNYIQVPSSANGKVFKWVAPVMGIPQGNSEPVILLVTPKQRQMLTVGSDYLLGKNTRSTVEFGLSNNDINTFSKKDKHNDADIALMALVENTAVLQRIENPWRLITTASYEQVNKNFTPIERFRTVEFERDWNILNNTINSNQYLPGINLTFVKNKLGALSYETRLFNAGNEYNAIKNSLTGNFAFRKYELYTKSSYLKSSGFDNNTSFMRHRAGLLRKFKHFTIGGWEDQEKNQIRNLFYDTLLHSSYQYLEWEGFISNPDTSVNTYRLSYKQRYDKTARYNKLLPTTFGESVGFDFGILQNPSSILKVNTTYRRLHINNSELTALKPENTLLNRIEYSLRLIKGTFLFNTFYEIGSGLEAKKTFSYLQVPASQGVYAYVGDFNENGVKDLNEFEISRFPDKAEYIKVYTPTNEYVKAYSNQFSQSVNINPAAIWSNKKGIRSVIARFANQSAFRIDRKTNYEDRIDAFNPFVKSIVDTALVSLNSSLRNTIFFNRSDPRFGLDYSYQQSQSKNLLINGFESRTSTANTIRSRWNITPMFLFTIEALHGLRVSNAQLFTNRNYKIETEQAEPKMTFQPNTTIRIAGSFKYAAKENKTGIENLNSKNFGIETRYSVLSKGNLLVNVNYIVNEFTGENNTTVAFEMLEGLQPGQNMVWNVTFEQNLSKNMQLNLNYLGRASQTGPPIHTGGVQVRAFF